MPIVRTDPRSPVAVGDYFTSLKGTRIMEYELVRSRRKTAVLHIDPAGRLMVKAPLHMPLYVIEGFIEEKRDWIEKTAARMQAAQENRRARLGEKPSELPLWGEMVPVVHTPPYGYADGAFSLPEDMTLGEALPYINRLYRSIAKRVLIPRTWELAEKYGFSVSDVKISSAETRWGSCSGKKSINLSWKLAFAAPHLADYVIIHELCHTRFMDHSPRFWAEVGKYIPDHRQCREGLKETQRILEKYGI